MSVDDILPMSLELSVRLRVMEYEARGGPVAQDWERTKPFSQVLVEKGDVLQFGGKRSKSGEIAALFNQLADAVAVMAFAPGGVSLFGVKYQGKAS